MGSITFASLKTTKQFNSVYKQGRYFHTPAFVLYFKKESQTLLGVVASKKVGNAVKRNRAKRRLRALFREDTPSSEGHFILVAKTAIEEIDFQTLKKEYLSVVERLTSSKK